MHVYLAGPEVFLPDAAAILDRKRAILREHGLEPVIPVDLETLTATEPRERGLEISRRNEELVAGADACLANLTPFRGPSADVGTVYELGFAAALGKIVWAYSNDPAPYSARVRRDVYGGAPLRQDGHGLRGPDGLEVEEYELHDNLMLDGGVIARGGRVIVPETAPADPARDMSAFTACVTALAAGQDRP